MQGDYSGSRARKFREAAESLPLALAISPKNRVLYWSQHDHGIKMASLRDLTTTNVHVNHIDDQLISDIVVSTGE